MQKRQSVLVAPGQELCDVTGKKVGIVSRVYRRAEYAGRGGEIPAAEDIVEVRTGFMGLGRKLYVPVGALTESIGETVFVQERRGAFNESWKARPSYLTKPT